MHPQPVPSKAALRILRQLAFASSAAAAVGIGTFNYHVYRRIRVLEKIRDTSRQIRALSNGDGRADMQRRIEAAEQGEDFSQEAMRAYRSRKKRTMKYESGLPGSLLVGEGVWIHPPPPVPTIATDGAPELVSYVRLTVPRLPPASAPTHQEPRGRNHGPSREPSFRTVEYARDDEFELESRWKHRQREKWPLGNRMKDFAMADHVRAPRSNESKDGQSLSGPPFEPNHLKTSGPATRHLRAGQALRRKYVLLNPPHRSLNLHQPTVVSDGDADISSKSTDPRATKKKLREEDVDFQSPVGLSTDKSLNMDVIQDNPALNIQTDQPAVLIVQDKRPAQVDVQQDQSIMHTRSDLSASLESQQEQSVTVEGKTESAEVQWDRDHDPGLDIDISPALSIQPGRGMLASPRGMAEFWFDPKLEAPRVHHRARRIEHKFTKVGATLGTPFAGILAAPFLTEEIRDRMAKHLWSIFKQRGRLAAQSLWESIIAQRLHHRDSDSLAFFYREFSHDGTIQMRPKDPLFQELLQHFRQDGKYSYQAATMLFPDYLLSQNPKQDFQRDHEVCVHRIAAKQLEIQWGVVAKPIPLILELRRVIHAARLRETLPTEAIFNPVIRALTWMGEMEIAQTIFDEMVYYHGIPPTLTSRSLIILGYARKANWDRVEREIELIHASGLSRIAPHEYAIMFSQLFREYGKRTSIDQTHALLVKAVSQWGLIANSSVHTAVVKIFLESQRFDLVREWMQAEQRTYSQTPMETTIFCISITEMWARLGSSCEEIEQGIRAMVYRAPETDLRSLGRHLFFEALSRDLSPRVALFRQKSSPTEIEQHNSTPKLLDDLLSEVSQLTLSTIPADGAVALEMAELRQQALAAARARIFLGDNPSHKFLDIFCHTLPATSSTGLVLARTQVMTDTVVQMESYGEKLPAIDDIPTRMTQSVLPEKWRLGLALKAFYRRAGWSGVPASLGLLPWVTDQLAQSGRTAEGLTVLAHVYFAPSSYHYFAGLEPPVETLPVGAVRAHPLKREAEGGYKIDFYQHWLQQGFLAANLKGILRVLQEVVFLSELQPAYTTKNSHFPSAGKNPSNPLQVSVSFVSLARYVVTRVLRKSWKPLRTDPDCYGMGSTPQELDTFSEIAWLGAMVENRRKDQVGRWELPMRKNRSPAQWAPACAFPPRRVCSKN